MAEALPTLDDLKSRAKSQFVNRFGKEATMVVCAPGRVNLLGEHVDYCKGYVLPMAIPMWTVIAGRHRLNSTENTAILRTFSCPQGEMHTVTIDLTHPKESDNGDAPWSNYVRGVIALWPGKAVTAFDAVIVSSVPIGAGLSSSASLEVAMATFLEMLTGSKLGLDEKAHLCQKAEHEYAYVPCGIMDQYIICMAQEKHALLIDCRNLNTVPIPLKNENLAVLIINSNVKHQLKGSEYSDRRQATIDAAKEMKIPSLRDATMTMLTNSNIKSTDLLYQCTLHAIGEIDRTIKGAMALKEHQDYKTFGQLMYDSHDSLSNNLKVSCSELDELAAIALKFGDKCGIYGSRMTGGGFGGCTVTLIDKEHIDRFITIVKDIYKGTPTFYVCHPVGGAHILK